MIFKGGSRAAPKQLAYHLQRVDTNERVEILELNALSDTLEGAFYDWQTMSEATRSPNPRGLYHLNIDPAEQYTLTAEQLARCVEVAEEELKLQGQPRVVVMHEKHGRVHLHVVWCRTDYETLTLKRDNNNYYAHERASLRLELEFGHELVPGKFAKRNRQKQPEIPKADFNHAEWQKGERSGIDARERKDQIRALHAASANGQELKSALENAGYVLAQGVRGYMIVNQAGDHFVLGRDLRLKKPDVEAFMADVPLAQLPEVDDVKAMQKAKAQETENSSETGRSQAKPQGMTTAERRQQITRIRASCDDGLAFKNALEEAGYLLAKGTKNGYVFVDAEGSIFGLLPHISGTKSREFKAFMAPFGLASLPAAHEAQELQRQKTEQSRKASPEASPGVEASKFVSPETAPSAPEEKPKRADRMTAIAALHAAADGAQAFKAALEEAGYLLARGDKGYLVIDQAGGHSLLTRNLSLKKKEVDAFMGDVAPLAGLPTITDALALRKQRKAGSVPGPEEKGLEASRFVPTDRTRKAPEATPAPPKPVEQPLPVSAKSSVPSKFLPQRSTENPAAPQQTGQTRAVDIPAPSAAPPTAPPPEDPEITALRNTLRKSQDEDRQKWADFNAAEYRQKDTELRNEGAWKLEDFDLRQQADRGALSERLNPEHKGVRGVLDAINRRINPVEAARNEAAKQREIEELTQRQKNERRDFIKRLDQSRLTNLDSLKERQLQDQGERERKYKEETERFVIERQEAKRFLAEIEADRLKTEQERKELGLEEGESPPGTGK